MLLTGHKDHLPSLRAASLEMTDVRKVTLVSTAGTLGLHCCHKPPARVEDSADVSNAGAASQ